MFLKRAKPIDWARVRIGLVAVVFAVAAVFLVVRAYRLQVTDAAQLKKRAEKQRTRVLHLQGPRGMILDRAGEQMAAGLEVDSIYARPHQVSEKEDVAKVLAEALQMYENDLLRKLKENKPFVWIARRVSPLMSEKVKNASLKGIYSVTEYKRFYPLGSLAAHAIGFTGIDSTGLEGLELYYDKELAAKPIPVTAERDALGRPVTPTVLAEGPVRRDLRLNLDRNVQHVVEKRLQEAKAKERARGGTAIVMDADSGEILALAVRPTYNPNMFHKTRADVRRNRSLTDPFEPGSTFKVFLAAAALDLEKIGPLERFYCHKGRFRYRGATIHDLVPHETLSFGEVLIHSSNIGAVKISEKLTSTELYNVLKKFGFSSTTQLDLPGETPGMLMPPGRWSALTKANIAFGQGVSVNAMQITRAFAAVINGGILYRPFLVKTVTDTIGNPVRANRPEEVRKVISPATSAAMVEILRRAVESGTGKAAAIRGVDVIGKTGTGQKGDPSGGYSKDKYVTSFVGALMGIKPRVVIFVMIDEPNRGVRTGGEVAAPLFRKIAEGILALCGKQPNENDAVLASSPEIPEEFDPVERKRIRIKKGSGPGEWIIPKMKGLNVRQVVDVCAKIKCDPLLHGTGIVVKQSPEPGAVIREGATLEVSLEEQTS